MSDARNLLAPVPESYASFCQIVRRQLNGHSVACENLDVMLAHLARYVGQYLVPLAYPHLEGSVAHALDYGSINGDHVFSWNSITSFDVCRRSSTPGHSHP